MQENSVIKDKTFNFSLRVVKLYEQLIAEKKEYVMSKQILRSGTSIGANIAESKGAISTADFSNKVSIAYKEALESKYWLELLFKAKYIDQNIFDSLFKDVDEICRILFSIIKTTRLNKTKPANN